MSHERSGATLAPRARDSAPAAAFPCPSRILGSRSFLYRVDLGLDGRGLPSVVETRARHAASGGPSVTAWKDPYVGGGYSIACTLLQPNHDVETPLLWGGYSHGIERDVADLM